MCSSIAVADNLRNFLGMFEDKKVVSFQDSLGEA